MSLPVPAQGTSDDPYIKFGMAIQQRSFGLSVGKRVHHIIEGCKKINIDGVLDRYHVGCRSVAADALLIEEAVKKELGIPVLVLEWENFDPRAYNHEQFKSRFEVFKAMMKSKSA
jgi:benzoyl-CoA reductase/2-hydroxyglutaryl-CoA dehydratase subunit BcrC/BadD/HgdB